MEQVVTTLAGKPETTFPERGKLAGVLKRYRELNTEASGLESKLARLERDEAEVLNEVGVDEEAQARALGEIQSRIEVTRKRIGHKNEELSKALGALEAAIGPATVELNGALLVELSRRREVLESRVLEAISYPKDKPIPNGLFGVVTASPLLGTLRELEPNLNAWSPLSIEQKAAELLGKIERLETEMEKSI